jgi:ribosomal protein S19
MITKVVIALLLFSQGTMIEHTVTKGVNDCLKMKREMLRNMSDSVQIMCQKVEADIEVIHGKEFIRSMRKM